MMDNCQGVGGHTLYTQIIWVTYVICISRPDMYCRCMYSMVLYIPYECTRVSYDNDNDDVNVNVNVNVCKHA
jgi:hypothetical protein